MKIEDKAYDPSEKKSDNITAAAIKDKDGAFLRRVFRNESGDWKEADKLVAEINKYALVWDGLAEDLVKVQQKIEALTLKAYQMAPTVEGLYYDSPISPAHQMAYSKQHLRKLGWGGVRDIFTPVTALENFSKKMKDACRWLLKFKENDKA